MPLDPLDWGAGRGLCKDDGCTRSTVECTPINVMWLIWPVHPRHILYDGLPPSHSRQIACKHFGCWATTNKHTCTHTHTDASGAAKEAFSALAVLLYEAARVDADSASLKYVPYLSYLCVLCISCSVLCFQLCPWRLSVLPSQEQATYRRTSGECWSSPINSSLSSSRVTWHCRRRRRSYAVHWIGMLLKKLHTHTHTCTCMHV